MASLPACLVLQLAAVRSLLLLLLIADNYVRTALLRQASNYINYKKLIFFVQLIYEVFINHARA